VFDKVETGTDPMDDQKALELINRRLTEPISEHDQAELELHVADSPEVRKYLELSQQIQTSLEAQPSDAESGPGLSQVARSRIAKRLAIETAAPSKDSIDSTGQVRRVAEDKTNYDSPPEDSEDAS
jgi:hypothetical protein